ncbi:MAG: flavodoxin-dependent (E)-4-hydroxy-3-methylbut-2-enyl-diphosphate synthase, partial [Planctomycetota bacterium]|nr:flavodoxin-dependent (E)-4-hydroxy-3-methylbut-2-enyl-diphosphate synthase [Planctomycetota bacterium]
MVRRQTRTVTVGDIKIGSQHPIVVQSMTCTDTDDAAATIAQVNELVEAGCEMVRITVDTDKAADALPEIIAACSVPIIADIHFTHRLALRAIEAGVAKVRINPGNIGSDERVREVVEAAKKANIAMRIGVNSGSVEKDLLEKYGYPSPQALVDSAVRHCENITALGFTNFVVSLKSTDTKTVVEAN